MSVLSLMTPRTVIARVRGCVAVVLTGCGLAQAAELSDAGRREVAELLSRIEKSGCEFSRGGSWYTGTQARTHLQRKYQYLLDRNQLGSTEDFVAMVATRSSMTGENYTIRCGSAAPVASVVWLDAELRRLRQTAPPR